MAISTYKVFLMNSADNGTTWTKLIDIKEYPDLMSPPEMIETTTLSDKMRTYILGIQEADALTFTANYTYAEYQTLTAKEGVESDYAVWFGGTESGGVLTPDGSAGKFSFKGQMALTINGGSVNEVVNLTITIAPTSVITFA